MLESADKSLPVVIGPPKGKGPPVLLLHSWWGLTQSFTDYAWNLARQGFLVGCVDLYGGRVAETEADARVLRRARRRQPMYRTIVRAIEALVADPRASSRHVGLVGFSMGGHWAVWLTQRPELPVGAVVLYYAARSTDFSLTATPFLAHFADRDPFVSASARRNMELALAKAGRRYLAFDYPGTGHWFAESASDAFDVKAADLAFDRTVAFMGANLR
ncbi:MAG: dienelactone hydrolase family protein [Phyllobacteriaceae bacterium]|nr:dienelactone hydrolase family protein [Phyllobacteriaceae bacterium]